MISVERCVYASVSYAGNASGSFAGCTATKLASGRQLRGCVADKALA